MQGNDDQIKLYQAAFKKHGVSPKSLLWHNYGSLALRYQILIKYLNLNNKSILEIGSGFGDFTPYLYENAQNYKYLGLDIVPEFINIAKLNHPNFNFQNQNILKNPLNKKFDIVISSGAFNHNVKNNLIYRKKAIKAMWDQTKQTLAFNMAGNHPQPANHTKNIVYYADSLEIFNFCAALSSKIILDQSYRVQDFTIIIKK